MTVTPPDGRKSTVTYVNSTFSTVTKESKKANTTEMPSTSVDTSTDVHYQNYNKSKEEVQYQNYNKDQDEKEEHDYEKLPFQESDQQAYEGLDPGMYYVM